MGVEDEEQLCVKEQCIHTIHVKAAKGCFRRSTEQSNVHKRCGVIKVLTAYPPPVPCLIVLDCAQILSESGDVRVENSLFYSNMANKFGGAICMDDGSLYVVDSSFKNNEVSQEDTEDGVGQGGDIYVADGVVLSVYSTTFSSSSADFAGAAIKCCGAMIDNCTFASIETSIEGVRESKCPTRALAESAGGK